MPENKPSGEVVLRGVAAAPGVCRGRLVTLRPAVAEVPRRTIAETEVAGEIGRLQAAIVATRSDLQEVQRRVVEAMGAQDANIFEAHLLVLEDRMLLDEVIRAVREQHLNIEAAFHDTAERYIRLLAAIDDEYLRERVADLRDVAARVAGHLRGTPPAHAPPRLTEPAILVSHDLAPSVTAQLDKRQVLGLVTEVGSKTSHTAILARSLGIPAVVGVAGALDRVAGGEPAILDGHHGTLTVNPSDQTLFEYGQLSRRQWKLHDRLKDLAELPAVTLDGVRLILSANLEQAEDAPAVLPGGADGVGLFRTEFLFIHRQALPTEEEQYAAYRRVAEAAGRHGVIIRTLDIGGDKFLTHLPMPREVNPFLGWRAIRFCLQQPALFHAQLRAILRASAHGRVRVMYPMVSGREELLAANAHLDECKAALRREGVPFDEDIEAGTMVEIPSAALVAGDLAPHCRFFSLGTNDLIQYTLAIDRLNDRIAHLYQPTHPAVLRLIALTVEAGRRHGLWTGVCGEMAGDPALVPLLIGLGVEELSVALPSVPRIKYLVRRLRYADCAALAEFALKEPAGPEILHACTALAARAAEALFETETPPTAAP